MLGLRAAARRRGFKELRAFGRKAGIHFCETGASLLARVHLAPPEAS